MHRILKKNQIFTIPNLLSAIRLALIPLIIWLYCIKQNYYFAVGVILLSGLTDIVDGFIARHFNMVSDFGKIFDPIADKLTEIAIMICLAFRYRLIIGIVVLFVVKELLMGVLGILIIHKKGAVNSAKWHGKINTVILYVVMILLILFPSMSATMANCLLILCGFTMICSLWLYTAFYIRLLREP